MKTCPECGCENVDNVRFCKNCGSEFNQNENSQNNTCPNCGHKIDDGMKFCRNCGYNIGQKHENVKQTKFCTNCGAELSEDAKFCPECGISPTEQPTYSQTQSLVKTNKSPLLAVLLSFFLPGLGQAYLGLFKKGIILFIIAMIGGFLMSVFIGYIFYLIAWGYGMYDGYNSAEKMNKDIKVEDKIDINNLF